MKYQLIEFIVLLIVFGLFLVGLFKVIQYGQEKQLEVQQMQKVIDHGIDNKK